MLSPFLSTPLPNSTIYIPEPSGSELITDPETGNVVEQDVIREYLAYLSVDKENKEYKVEGLDFSRLPVKGRLVKPMTFSFDFYPPITVDCEIELVTGLQKGKLELEMVIELGFVSNIAGQKIKGIFSVTGNSL